MGVTPAGAHGFGQRYDLPLPLSLYLFGGAAAVAFSFVVVGLFVRSTPPARARSRVDLFDYPLGKVVAALSEWLVHTNRRQDGAWSQRYEYGLPVTDLLALSNEGDTTGTTVRFRAAPAVTPIELPDLVELARVGWPHLSVEIRDERSRSQVRS